MKIKFDWTFVKRHIIDFIGLGLMATLFTGFFIGYDIVMHNYADFPFLEETFEVLDITFKYKHLFIFTGFTSAYIFIYYLIHLLISFFIERISKDKQ